MCRRAYGEIHLHRPLGDQLRAVRPAPAGSAHARGRLRRHADPRAGRGDDADRHARGRARERGFYLGHTLSGSRQPVRFNLREGSDGDRNTTILSVGALGSGKTTLDQKLKYEGFLQGARIIDCDPKGDHRLHLLEEVAPHTRGRDAAPRSGAARRARPAAGGARAPRQDAAVSFLRDLLPGRAEPAWETAVVGAVDRVLRRAREPTCHEVVRALARGRRDRAQGRGERSRCMRARG